MLARWTEILPLFVVRWLASRKCERMVFGDTRLIVVQARPDVLITVSRPKKSHPQPAEKPNV